MRCKLPDVAAVEMIITTLGALPSGVMTFGVKLHCAPEGSPVGQESVTRLGKDELAIAGEIVS